MDNIYGFPEVTHLGLICLAQLHQVEIWMEVTFLQHSAQYPDMSLGGGATGSPGENQRILWRNRRGTYREHRERPHTYSR